MRYGGRARGAPFQVSAPTPARDREVVLKAVAPALSRADGAICCPEAPSAFIRTYVASHP